MANPIRQLAYLLAAAVLFGLALAGCGETSSTESGQNRAVHPENLEKRPNILWISIEDASPRIGAYGDSLAQTPHIDRLARQGMTFTNAYTVAGVCAPNRSAIITGMYQNSIGTHHMRTTHQSPGLPTPYSVVPPPYVKTFTEYLRADGYFTTNNAKTDYQFTTPETAWDENGNQAHWRSENRGDNQPFFSVFNFGGTHESRSWADHQSNEGEELETDPDSVSVPSYYPDTPAVRRHIARQYDNMAEVDHKVGELLQQLQDDGLADETIVFFWSDHGDGLPRAKRWIYDSGIHIPLIVRAPDYVEPGSVDDELVSSVDFGPTVLSLAGVEVPVHMQGRPFLGSQAGSEREYVYAARDRFDESYDMVRAVRDGRYKYIRNYYPNQPYVLHVPYRNRGAIMQELLRLHAQGELQDAEKLWMRDTRPPEELYDTQSDPHEVNNLANNSSYADVLTRMRGALDDWMRRIDDRGDISEEQMVAQWYPQSEQPTTEAPMILRRTSTGMPQQETYQFDYPREIVLYSATQGASIAYMTTTEQDDNPHWRLYTGPLLIDETTTVRAKAIRYGYQESGETVATVEVE
jgi:arylsulfatase A-like enzyme